MSPELQKIFTVDPFKEMNQGTPGEVCNLVKGKWVQSETFRNCLLYTSPSPRDS